QTLWWPWEVRGYWSDGTVRCAVLLDNERLMNEAAAPIKYTFANAQADGYLGPEFLRTNTDANRWPHAVFFRAAVAWHDVTQDPMVIERLRRHYLGHQYEYVADRAATNIEAMLWTYRKSGDARLLKLAETSYERSQHFLSRSDGSFGLTARSMLSPGPCREVHGVTYAELSKIPALLYMATGNAEYLDVAVASQRKIFEHHLLVGGIPSSSETLSTTTARDAHEVCDVVDFCWTWGYLLQAACDGQYGDRIEKAIFNALPGSLRKDWKALQYYSSPNQFLCTEESCHIALMKGTPLQTIKEWRYLQRMSYRPSPGDKVVCCPGNLSRALPNYIGRMWMEDTKGRGVVAALYGPSHVKCKVGTRATPLEIETVTDYPYSEEIVFRFRLPTATQFPLHLRIPAWCASPSLSLNGAKLSLPAIDNGFAALRRVWNDRDELRLTLPMKAATSKWPEDGVAFEHGPLVYALPIKEQWSVVPDEKSSPAFPAWNVEPRSAWNYTLLHTEDAPEPKFERLAMTEDPWVQPPVSISVAARRVRDWELIRTQAGDSDATITPRLPDPGLLTQAAIGPTEELRLIPYASTALRLTIFPRLKTRLT
ncbi:MAG TPA: beta-L-arabinofuranosidase domain-containing protein, partial [Steroidobacteraceae bacterium]|nr:beta-L-arabinofuranosidase domain-containing protein [Steroidobacteraceae bacterium]